MRWSAHTSKGLVRADNEDSWTVKSFEDTNSYLAMVADGIGGADGGEVASALAVKVCAEYILSLPAVDDPKSVLLKAFAHCNQVVLQASFGSAGYLGMGTTLTSALVDQARGKLYVGHVGDSRAYVVSKGSIRQVTEDHSVTGELIRNGTISEEDAIHHPNRNVLTRALGTQEIVTASIYEERLLPGDAVLLCTDGLTSLVNTPDMVEMLKHASGEEVAKSLVDTANDRGGYDNITVVILWPDVPLLP